MRAVIQRVRSADVHVEGRLVSHIDAGVMTLLGCEVGDTQAEVEWVIKKIAHLRIFEDDSGKMNRSLFETGGQHLIVSQFTLAAEVDQGRRPSFLRAGSPNVAQELYLSAIETSKGLGLDTVGGEFQANMQVSLVNDGPATFIIERKNALLARSSETGSSQV